MGDGKREHVSETFARLLRRYRTLRTLGVGRIASVRAAWRVEYGRVPEYEEWPEPEDGS